jgi:hypothetical protein
MFIQDTPPDTSAYMIAGYAFFFVLMIIYLVSLYLRSRNLNEDLTVLESMKEQSPVMEGKVQAGKSEPVKPIRGKSPSSGRRTAKAKARKSNRVRKKITKKK